MCLAQRKQAKLLFVHPFDLNDRLKSFLSQNAVPLHEIDHRSAALEKNIPQTYFTTYHTYWIFPPSFFIYTGFIVDLGFFSC